MGDCKTYRWLDNPDRGADRLIRAKTNDGRPYDFLGYLWTVGGSISMVWFNQPLPAVQLDVFLLGKPLQFHVLYGERVAAGLSAVLTFEKIINALETGNAVRTMKLAKRMEKSGFLKISEGTLKQPRGFHAEVFVVPDNDMVEDIDAVI